MDRLQEVARAFVLFRRQGFDAESVVQGLAPEIRPYFFCIEALQQDQPGR